MHPFDQGAFVIALKGFEMDSGSFGTVWRARD
jgi:hypothetical protein